MAGDAEDATPKPPTAGGPTGMASFESNRAMKRVTVALDALLVDDVGLVEADLRPA